MMKGVYCLQMKRKRLTLWMHWMVLWKSLISVMLMRSFTSQKQQSLYKLKGVGRYGYCHIIWGQVTIKSGVPLFGWLELVYTLKNLGLHSSSDPEVNHDITSRVSNFLSQSQWEGPEIEVTQVPFPLARPPPIPLQASIFHNDPQQVSAAQGNLLPAFGPHGPLPLRGPLPYTQHVGNHAFFRPVPPFWPLMPPRMQQGIPQGFTPGFLQQQSARQYASLPFVPRPLIQRQFGHPRLPFVNAHQALFNPLLSVHPDPFCNENDSARNFGHEFEQRHRQVGRSQQQRSHGSGNSFHRDATHQHFRSKYMTVDEIEGIAKVQRAATQNSDPYVGDYYHQAVQAKNRAGAIHGKQHFAPHQLRDWSSHRRSSTVQPAFVPVDGLGKVPFTSVRCPRPLLEVEKFSAQSGGGSRSTLSERPLEQEPMLAARIAIEDGSCRLLDVDDIDRYLSVSHLPDGGAQLRWQRETLLEDLAASLQLLDHCNSRLDNIASSTKKTGHLVEVEGEDSVFLHIVSRPKGRKLLYRFFELLPEGTQLIQCVCKIIFGHLHCLFGVHQQDSEAAAVTAKLAKKVASCASQMELNALSACLAAAVSSSEQPSFQPLVSASSDGASLILKSSLDRATCLLTVSKIAWSLEDRLFWQTTFDNFFLVLYRYCTNTFDRILHTMAMPSSSEGALIINDETAVEKMSKVMPIELLRASLPHMNDQQRKTLLDFTQRSIATEPHNVRRDITHINQADEVSD